MVAMPPTASANRPLDVSAPVPAKVSDILIWFSNILDAAPRSTRLVARRMPTFSQQRSLAVAAPSLEGRRAAEIEGAVVS
jgi:hypothetical protein